MKNNMQMTLYACYVSELYLGECFYIKASAGNIEETSKSKLDFESIRPRVAECAQVGMGTWVDRQFWLDGLIIILWRPQTPDFFLFFVRSFDLLIAFGM